ncbi:CRAL-TRIO domain-containing protein [Zychaea mexicana]|uniref:CRAL-TRIO domain-containing protein n=1 Tax=Zychaea mexicana TaxID=64656 RepID=UPI0022FDDFED|nr:CRAL-TRIO domain-containing protein [Zychaea mexicana]KAI9494364.1 CRAL-TRIO domain-containing protein [Zychaea mexicana]
MSSFFHRSKSRSNSLYNSDSSNRSVATTTTTTLSQQQNDPFVTHEPKLGPPHHYSPASVHPPLDGSQWSMLAALRCHINGIMLPTDHPYYPNEKAFLTDATLRRHLHARKWDFESSKSMLESTIRWRRDYRPDQIDPEYVKPEVESGKMYFNGFDTCGRPIWIIRPRLQNSKDEERQTKHIIFCLERGIRLMPSHVDTIAIIVDFKGAAYSHSPSIATCKRFLNILGDHYPERLGIAFVVDSPWFFFATFKVISPFMDPQTRAKIKFVYDKNNKKTSSSSSSSNKEQQLESPSAEVNAQWVHLEDYISPDALETEFGGNHSFAFHIEYYWNALLGRTGAPYEVLEYL